LLNNWQVKIESKLIFLTIGVLLCIITIIIEIYQQDSSILLTMFTKNYPINRVLHKSLFFNLFFSLQDLLKHSFNISFSLILLSVLSLSFVNFTPSISVQAASTLDFSPNYILHDSTFSSTRVFPTQQSVQSYLDKINSPLKNYQDNGKTAAYWIFAAARGETSSQGSIKPQINPAVLLAFLEKEMSLLSLTNYDVEKDPEYRIKYAMGYACPDMQACVNKYSGFSTQLNYAAFQLQYNFEGAKSNSRATAPYNLDTNIKTLDEYSFTPSNAATAACYRYTPHVYYGCYNLWKILTANGWGISTATYSYRELDRVNLTPERKNNFRSYVSVNDQEGDILVNKKYTLGQIGDDIRRLQVFLKGKGLFNGSNITGTFGPITNAGLIEYRKQKNIVQTNASADKLCSSLGKNYKIGDRNELVTNLQKCLQNKGLYKWQWGITGYFGEYTKEIYSKWLQTNEGCDTLKNINWTLKEESDRVLNLQKCLQKAGLFNRTPTGYFGETTQNAVKRWRS
jgi:peptidoglycan hydrolase-like protein with peptidoglycan-binding domain